MDKKLRYLKFHNILAVVIVILIVTAVVMTSYSLEAKANPDLWNSYYKAIDDAKNPEPHEISKNLTAITKDNRNLIWEGEPGESRILVTTWTKYNGYKLGLKEPQSIDIWVTVVPELKNFCSQYQSLGGGNLVLRLKQLLGLSPSSYYDKIVEMWVNPKYLFRPSRDPEITDHEAELEYPESEAFITVSSDHKQWFEAKKKKSYNQDNSNGKYDNDAQPWTQLGYTYDWGNPKSEIGLSEFVIKKGSPIKVKSITSTQIYCLTNEIISSPIDNKGSDTQKSTNNQTTSNNMILPSIVNIAISLFFIYLLLSLPVSAIQENLAAILQWRAEHLKKSITDILDRDSSNSEVTDYLYKHPLISSLNQSGNRSFFVKILNRPSLGPSYINSQTFSAALLEVLNLEYGLNFNRLSDGIDTIISELERIKNNNSSPKPPPQLVKTLSALARQVKYRVSEDQIPTIKEFQKEIANWFDESQERSKGVYKRNTSGVIFLISLVVSICLNVDSIYIVQRLYNDPILTESTINLAIQEVNAIETKCNISPAPSQCINEQISQSQLKEYIQQFRTFPIGWNNQENRIFFQSQQSPFLAFFGWFVSAIALSQGAPFWFDLLNKFINIREAGKQTDKSKSKQDNLSGEQSSRSGVGK